MIDAQPEPFKNELLKGSLDLLLLTLLAQQPMYGYQIVKEVRQRSAQLLHLKEGSLYPALHRLEQSGLVESDWQTRPDGASRRYYRLTTFGKAQLPQRRAAWDLFVQAMSGVLHHGEL